MSGIELIVGTVLSAVPITLETYDRSGRVLEVFSVFNQYRREVLILEAKLGADRSIFRDNPVSLLTAITKDRGQGSGGHKPTLITGRQTGLGHSLYLSTPSGRTR